MYKINFWVGSLAAIVLAANIGLAQTAKKITKDEVFQAIASQVITQSDSPLTNVKGALDEVMEIGEITINPKDNKDVVTIKEKAESNAMSTNKSIQLIFAQQPDGSWKWEQFKNDLKFYPVEKLFPYGKDELTRRREAANAAWKRFLAALTAEGEAAQKVIDTAKAVIKKEPEPAAALKTAREGLKKAIESNDADQIKAAEKDLNHSLEPISKLADENPDLKANDAFLRLSEGFENSRKNAAAMRKDYFTGVATFNDRIQRLPFSLVAFGFGFVKMEPMIEAEQQ